MPHQGQFLSAAAVTAGAIGGAYCAYQIYQNYYQKTRLPTEWTQVGTLSDLYIYPVKSCAPVISEKAECTTLGLANGWLRDRVLMVVDKNMNFVTARAHPELLTVQPSVKSSVLTLQHAEMEPLHLNLAEVVVRSKPTTADVWGTQVSVYDCCYEPSEWFSRLMDKSPDNFRLVYYASQKSRTLRVGAENSFYKFTKNDTGALTDEVSFNMINEASVEDLNKRLRDCKVSHRNFRPNFVLKGAQPYEEDKWKFVKIGDNVFEIIKPCGRCVLTTTDPETGVRNAKTEPLETLKSYRQVTDPEERKAAGSSPRMGLQMALRSAPGGIISLNDPIYVA